MAHSKTLVRMQDSAGNLFNVAPGKDMDAFIAGNPGAKQVAGPSAPSDEVEMPEKAESEDGAAKGKGK